MCGIAGVAFSDPLRQVDRVGLRRMTASLRHRGPDGEGFHGGPGVGLGFRRLAIVDLATGDQPIFNEDRSVAVVCNGTLGGGAADAVGSEAAELAGRGFATLKVKAGTGDDEGRLGAVRAAAGPEVALRVDANGSWSVAEAVAKLEALATVGLELAEQPCADARGLAAVRARCEVPIVADESVATRADADHCVELGACDAATLKLAKVGGPHVALALAADLPCYLSSALDSALGVAAAVHTAQALPTRGFAAGRAHGLATAPLFADDVADAAAFAGPTIAPPDRSGLGVEVSEAALERLRIEVRR